MHRPNRCLLALAVLLFSSAAPGAHAQDIVPPLKAKITKAKITKAKATHAAPKPAGRLSQRLRLGDGRQTWHPTRRQLGVSYAAGGSDASPAGTFQFVVNRAPLRRYLSSIAPYIRRAPKSAHPFVANDTASDDGSGEVPAIIVPGYDGGALDTDAAVDLIQKTLIADPGTLHIVLPMKTKPARVTQEALKGVNARIGYFVTRFNPGDEGRTDTVRRAISIINGTIVPPGGVFSVDKTVGPRDPAHGFNGKGHVFVDGHMEMQSGGGMCQVATTLFNAAMLADLKIVERHQHVRTVPYVDPGRDSTIYHGQKDFRLQNNTSAPIYISYRTNRSHAIVSLFGQATPGRKVRLVSRHRQLGERHFTGTFYRVVTEPDGKTYKDSLFHSNYKWTPDLDFSH